MKTRGRRVKGSSLDFPDQSQPTYSKSATIETHNDDLYAESSYTHDRAL